MTIKSSHNYGYSVFFWSVYHLIFCVYTYLHYTVQCTARWGRDALGPVACRGLWSTRYIARSNRAVHGISLLKLQLLLGLVINKAMSYGRRPIALPCFNGTEFDLSQISAEVSFEFSHVCPCMWLFPRNPWTSQCENIPPCDSIFSAFRYDTVNYP